MWMGFGWITKMIPFIDMFPTLTLSAWRIVSKPAQDRQRRASKMGDRRRARMAYDQQRMRETQILRGPRCKRLQRAKLKLRTLAQTS